MTASHPDLRTRRRRQTEREIRLAALRLAHEHGFEDVTTQMISTEAGVSPRTFFNYFPSKEAAILPPRPELPPDVLAGFAVAGPADPRVVLKDLTALLLEDFAANHPQGREIHAALALAERYPKLLAQLLEQFEEFRRSLATAVAQRLEPERGDETADLIAGLAIAVVRVGLERWAQAEPRDGSPLAHVERAVGLLHDLLSPDDP